MSVYKEGYHAVQSIQKQSKQIWQDACDFGAPIKKNDNLWNLVKQLTDWYGIKGTRKYTELGSAGHYGTLTQYVFLMDEWAISDQRKTEKQGTDYFKVTYHKLPIPGDYNGFVEVEKVTDVKLIAELTEKVEAHIGM